MESTNFDSPAASTKVLRPVVLIYGGLMIVSMTINYLNGFRHDGISNVLFSWAWAGTFAVILSYARLLNVPPKRDLFRFLFLAPAVVQMGQDLARFKFYSSPSLIDAQSEIEVYFFALSILDMGIAVVAIVLLRNAFIQRVRKSLAFPEKDLGEVASGRVTAPASKIGSSHSVGRGGEYIDRVIYSVLGRLNRSERVASFSLAVMLFLVLVGGMASFGLWAFTHADRISTLENEQRKLVHLQSNIKLAVDKLPSGNDDSRAQLNRVIKFIDDEYSPSDSFKDTLNRLSLQSQTNYADIAIRVTIAVLTIFLVQVFFSVYKYNQHLANILAAKAEALELVGNDKDARKELSREAISIVKESVPGFGTNPRTPIEQVSHFAEKFGK